MAALNSIEPGAHCTVKPSLFFVTATREIKTPRRIIYPGEHVLIDPEQAPTAGKMVLLESTLELWDGQDHVRGIAVAIYSEEVPHG